MKKKIIYTLPFIIYSLFYLFAIIITGIDSLIFPDVILLLVGALITGWGFYSENKKLNIIAIISLFLLSSALIISDVRNTYFCIFESIVATITILYYLIIFICYRNKKSIIMNLILIVILLIMFLPIKLQYRDGGTVEYRALTYKVIKWNRLNQDTTYYKDTEVLLFPNNFIK